MYKFITVARNTLNELALVPMYIYQNEDNKKYYISRMYPNKSIFQGSQLVNDLKFFALEYPQEISENDFNNKRTLYYGMTWSFN